MNGVKCANTPSEQEVRGQGDIPDKAIGKKIYKACFYLEQNYAMQDILREGDYEK